MAQAMAVNNDDLRAAGLDVDEVERDQNRIIAELQFGDSKRRIRRLMLEILSVSLPHCE